LSLRGYRGEEGSKERRLAFPVNSMAWEVDWELEDDSAGAWEELEASEA